MHIVLPACELWLVAQDYSPGSRSFVSERHCLLCHLSPALSAQTQQEHMYTEILVFSFDIYVEVFCEKNINFSVNFFLIFFF